MELINKTPFPAEIVVLPDKDGYETLVVVVKGTYAISGAGCARAEEPLPLVMADEWNGKPGESSLRWESDLALYKPATDVVLIGHAYAPGGKAKEGQVLLQVGPLSRAAQIHGDRRWQLTLGIPHVSGPEPFEKIPLVYERAFGGVQKGKESKGAEEFVGAEERNPVGTGFVKRMTASFVDGMLLPNIEDPKHGLKRPGQTPPPVGFGFVARHWLPRRLRAGTYDEAWQKERLPLLPKDFDEAAFCGAPEELQARPHLKGGEAVMATGVSPLGPLRFNLPVERPEIEVHFQGDWMALPSLLDTVVIEPDDARVSLTWRSRLRIHNQVRAVRAVRVRGPK